MDTPRRFLARAIQTLLSMAVLAPVPAQAEENAQASLEGAGWRQGDNLSDGRSSSALIAGASVESGYSPRPESILDHAELENPSGPVWGVRGYLRGTALFSPDRLRGTAAGGADVDLGYFRIWARASYGYAPSFRDRYWRSGRNRLEPGLGFGGRGFAWPRGPTEIRVFAWRAFMAAPIAMAGQGNSSLESRASLDLMGNLRAAALHRLRDDRYFDLTVFDTTVRRYGDGQLLSIAIDVLGFQTRPVHGGWLAQAAIGMSALRLTPVPHATDEPSPGQAVPAAHLGIGYQAWITTEVRVATFHRIDPSGAAIDRGGLGELLLTHPMGNRWSWSVAAAFVVAKRVRVESTLDPGAPQFHDWLFPRRLSASISRHLGAGWRLGAHAFAEASDRDDPLLLSTASPRFRSSLGGGIGLSWTLPVAEVESPRPGRDSVGGTGAP